MLIERNLAPALIAVGVALVLPGVALVLKHAPVEPGAGGLVAGNFLAALGLMMWSLLAAEVDAWILRFLLLGVLGLIALAFTVGTAIVALHPAQGIRWVVGAFGLLPTAATALGVGAALRR